MACFAFAFMAGQYGTYAIETNNLNNATKAGNSTTLPVPQPAWGPSNFGRWLEFWVQDTTYSFDFKYLYTWGGRCAAVACQVFVLMLKLCTAQA